MIGALYAMLILCGLSWGAGAAGADEAKPVTAILLTARADLPDPRFKDAVVLVMNHVGTAPAGVIVNKPTRIPIAQLFPEFEHLAGPDDRVYFGGPVAIEAVSFIFRAAKPHRNATEILPGIYLGTSRELLRELLGREKPMEGLRIYIGYSGWAPGQLEREIARGDWNLSPADASAIFGGQSDRPWPEPNLPGAGQRAYRAVPEVGNVLIGTGPPPG